jgi:hypothetical protein
MACSLCCGFKRGLMVCQHLWNRFTRATETARQIVGTHQRPISADTVRHRLVASNLRCYRPARGPVLTPRHRQQRLRLDRPKHSFPSCSCHHIVLLAFSTILFCHLWLRCSNGFRQRRRSSRIMRMRIQLGLQETSCRRITSML